MDLINPIKPLKQNKESSLDVMGPPPEPTISVVTITIPMLSHATL